MLPGCCSLLSSNQLWFSGRSNGANIDQSVWKVYSSRGIALVVLIKTSRDPSFDDDHIVSIFHLLTNYVIWPIRDISPKYVFNIRLVPAPPMSLLAQLGFEEEGRLHDIEVIR